MSQRGSFCTEYIDCPSCFEKIRKALIGNEKYLCSIAIPSWIPNKEPLPIVAGKIGSLVHNGEVSELRRLIDDIESGRCCTITVVVMPESAKPVIITIPADTTKKEINQKVLKKLVLKKDPSIEVEPEIATEQPYYRKDSESLVQKCLQAGYEIDVLTAYNVWSNFSGDNAAGWLSMFYPNIIGIILQYCDVVE